MARSLGDLGHWKVRLKNVETKRASWRTIDRFVSEASIVRRS